MIKTDFIKLYEELNSLNEEVLKESSTDFSKIPTEDLLTKCIIDGEPWPINSKDHSKDGVVPFYTALNQVVNIIKNMDSKNKAEFTLDWVAVGSVKDLTDDNNSSLTRNWEYDIAVEMADRDLNRVIQQVGSDETELSSLQKLPILLNSNIIMCCRPSSTLEEAKEDAKEEGMGNIVVYLGGVGKLKPYYSDIQQAFKQIKKAYEGSFLSKVTAKLFKREELEVEELNSLNEAVSPEAQAFYKSLNNKYKNLVDTESFIKAFKKDIPDAIWNKLFDDAMKLKNRGTYGIIKTEPLPAEVTVALKKYWVYQFTSGITYFETTTMIAKEEAERKKREDERQAKMKADQEKAKRVIDLIDKQALDKLTQLVKELNPDKMDKINNGPIVHTRTDGIAINGSAVCVSFYTINLWMDTNATEQELVDEFNEDVLAKIQELEEIKAEKLAKQNRQEKYKNAKWYSEEFEKWASANSKGIFLFQLSEDEGVQRFTKLSWDLIERCHFTDDVELIAVITSYSPEKRNPNSATENGYYYEYYSVNSKANPADLEDEGILLDPSKFVDDSSWGRKTYKEISSATAERDPYHYFISGMDKWFEYESVSYSSD